MGQRKYDDESDEEEDENSEDAALGAGGSSAQDGLADWVRGEQVEFDHRAAVGYAVEEGLGPVPCGVEADGPPEGAGAPEAEAEDHSGESGGDEADGGLARVAAVAGAEEEGEDQGSAPEAECRAVGSLEGPAVEAGEAAGECVLKIAAGEVLLEQADDEEAYEPCRCVADDVAAEEKARVDDEKAGLPEDEDEHREEGDSPEGSNEEERQLALAAEAVDADRAALDARHDPADEGDDEEGDGFRDDGEEWAGIGPDGSGCVFRQEVDQVTEESGATGEQEKEDDEGQDAPAGAKAIGTDEDAVEGRGRNGGLGRAGGGGGEFVQGSLGY